MFRAAPPNPYDELVLKATDETLTSENWSVLIEVCDKVVADKTPTGPRDCVASLQKRLQHRSANVQLYCLTLGEALVKNCGEKLQKEVASRTFMKVLVGIVTDRYTHDKVKKRVLQCLDSWQEDFKGNANLGMVEETVEELKQRGYQHKEEPEPSAHPPDDVLKREEEELQRALRASEQEAEWMGMAGVGTFPSNTALGSRIGPGGYAPAGGSSSRVESVGMGYGVGVGAGGGPTASGYGTNKSLPDPHQHQSMSPNPRAEPPVSQFGRVSLSDGPPPEDVSLHPPTGAELYPMRTKGRPAPLRVRALYDFEPNEEGELPFKEGDVIKVIDSAYKDWWKGELKGQTGIFPVNYVEPIPDPTPESITREAEAEAAVFSQAGEIDKLLQMMRSLDAKRDNLADNDELTELYQRTLILRPKIVRLIEKYTQKKAELLQMNDKFMRAKKTYDNMIEESLAKYHPGVAAEAYTQPNVQYQQQQQQQQQRQQQPYAAPHGYYQQPLYGYEQPYPQQSPAGYPSQASSRPPVPQQAAHAPPPQVDQAAPEGIDTGRYYLASDGNWYAYSPEQLAAQQQAPGQGAPGTGAPAGPPASQPPQQQPQGSYGGQPSGPQQAPPGPSVHIQAPTPGHERRQSSLGLGSNQVQGQSQGQPQGQGQGQGQYQYGQSPYAQDAGQGQAQPQGQYGNPVYGQDPGQLPQWQGYQQPTHPPQAQQA